MESLLFSMAFTNLGNALQNLKKEAAGTAAISEHVETSLFYFNEAEKYLTGFMKEYGEIARQLAQYIGDPNEIRSADDFSYIEKYRQIRDAGGTPDLIYKIAKSDGVQDIMHWRILKKLFGLELEEIQALIEKVETPTTAP
jgi:hypothetical protein